MNENVAYGIKRIVLRVVLPFIVLNLLLGVAFAFLLGSVNYIAHGSIAKTWSFGIEQATRAITTEKN